MLVEDPTVNEAHIATFLATSSSMNKLIGTVNLLHYITSRDHNMNECLH